MILMALGLAVAAPDYTAAMERCAARVVALRHPGGMVDAMDMSFEWLQVSGADPKWVLVGSIVEPDGGRRIARRFTCRFRDRGQPDVRFGKVVVL